MYAMLFTTLFLAAPESPYGVNAHIPNTADLDAAQTAGFGWLRYDFNWNQIEPAPGEYHWDVQDSVVDGAVQRGLNVFVTLAYTPKWAASDSSCVSEVEPN